MIDELIKRLDNIAKLNKDKFVYEIKVKTHGEFLRYSFFCCNLDDDHEFLYANGTSMNEMVTNVMNGIDNACKEWGYHG